MFLKLKNIFTFLIFVSLSASAFSDTFQGKWICTITNAEDNSSGEYIYEISSNTLKLKFRGSSMVVSEYSLAIKGKTNPFVAFVQKNNSLSEEIIVLRTTSSTDQLHANTISTSEGVRVKGRNYYGICDRI